MDKHGLKIKLEKLDSKVDDYNVEQILRPLSLGGAIQQGLQQNHNQINRGHQKEVLEIGWKDTWSAFWLPDIDLNLSITPHRVVTNLGKVMEWLEALIEIPEEASL